MKFSCIVLAGGSGLRFGSKKQFFIWHGKPLWQHVADKCKKASREVIVVGVDVKGGYYRQDSMYNGLLHVTNDRVVVCEAARPGVTVDQIKKIGKHVSINCSYAVTPIDTIFYKDKHLVRKKTIQIQTPQAFDTRLLKASYEKFKGKNYTSDTDLVQSAFNHSCFFLKGGSNLMKITYPMDLEILDIILNNH